MDAFLLFSCFSVLSTPLHILPLPSLLCPPPPPVSALTCIREERGNGKWKGKTSQPCPPSSSTDESRELMQKITVEAQSIHDRGAADGRGRGQRCFSLPLPVCGPTDNLLPPLLRFLAASLGSDAPAQQHHELCSSPPSTRAGWRERSGRRGSPETDRCTAEM